MMYQTEVKTYLGVSAGWLDKLWTILGKSLPKQRGERRYYTDKEIALLKLTIIIRRCGFSVSELSELCRKYVKDDVWNTAQLIQDNPVLGIRLERELAALRKRVADLLEFKRTYM